MKEWCFEHPFLTFFLIGAVLQCISNIFGKGREV